MRVPREFSGVGGELDLEILQIIQWIEWGECNQRPVVFCLPDDFACSLVMLAKNTGHGFTHALAVDKVAGIASWQAVVSQG